MVQGPVQVGAELLRISISQTIGKSFKELIGRVFRTHHPLPHGESFYNGGTQHFRKTRIDEYFVFCHDGMVLCAQERDREVALLGIRHDFLGVRAVAVSVVTIVVGVWVCGCGRMVGMKRECERVGDMVRKSRERRLCQYDDHVIVTIVRQ